MSPFVFSTSSSIAFRPDSIFVLLRRAYKDFDLGTVCRMVILLSLPYIAWWAVVNLEILIWLYICPLFQASRILQKFIEPVTVQEASTSPNAATPNEDKTSKPELSNSFPVVDYSDVFGEEFRIPVDPWDSSYLNILDLGEVEEGILHVLYACASQVDYCNRDLKLLKHQSRFCDFCLFAGI